MAMSYVDLCQTVPCILQHTPPSHQQNKNLIFINAYYPGKFLWSVEQTDRDISIKNPSLSYEGWRDY